MRLSQGHTAGLQPALAKAQNPLRQSWTEATGISQTFGHLQQQLSGKGPSGIILRERGVFQRETMERGHGGSPQKGRVILESGLLAHSRPIEPGSLWLGNPWV